MRSWLLRVCLAVVVAALVGAGFALIDATEVVAETVVHTRAATVDARVGREATLDLPFAAHDIAVHWRGASDARVSVTLSRDGTVFGQSVEVGRDDAGQQRGNGETYGGLVSAGGASVVRVTSDRPLGRVSVVALADGARTTVQRREPRSASASVAQPPILARSAWGADESLRFDATGKELWLPAFYPVQKLIVHHTDTQNSDPDPAATIRSIYYYHAVTQGWGDIGYNFVIDEAGHVYKGRASHPAGSQTDTLTGEDGSGNGVTAAHAQGFNSGTVGVALLGSLMNQDATPAAKNALEDLLAWKADAHHIDPQGSASYTNPVSGATTTFPNIAGHRDVNATECPGGVLYAALPDVRAAVAAHIAAASTTTTSSTTTTTMSTTTSSTTTTTTGSTTTSAAAYRPPGAPSSLSATTLKRKINLSWIAAPQGSAPIINYRVYRATASSSTFLRVASVASTAYTDTAITSGASYRYYVVAWDGSSEGPQSNTVSATAR